MSLQSDVNLGKTEKKNLNPFQGDFAEDRTCANRPETETANGRMPLPFNLNRNETLSCFAVFVDVFKSVCFKSGTYLSC